jgi:hypothetical protein
MFNVYPGTTERQQAQSQPTAIHYGMAVTGSGSREWAENSGQEGLQKP